MLKVGLTGGIGSGKSYIANIFKTIGIAVFSADDAAKNLLLSEQVRSELQELLGPESYENDQPNKKFIAQKIFSNDHLLTQVNLIIHPKTLQLFKEWCLDFEGKMDYVITETALLWESMANQYVDYSIGVYSPLPIRLLRLQNRAGYSAEDIRARQRQQIDPELKCRLCDFKIVNDDQRLILPQIIKIDQELRLLAAKTQF